MIKVYERPGGLYSPDTISAKPFAVVSHNHNQVVFPCFPPPLGGRQTPPPTTAGHVDTPIMSVARMAAVVGGGGERLANMKELLVDVLATERLYATWLNLFCVANRSAPYSLNRNCSPAVATSSWLLAIRTNTSM